MLDRRFLCFTIKGIFTNLNSINKDKEKNNGTSNHRQC